MYNYIKMFSEIFWTFVITTGTGLLFAVVKICLKSKCRHCKIGCIEIDRNVELELEESKFDVLNKPPASSEAWMQSPSPHRKNSINQFNV